MDKTITICIAYYNRKDLLTKVLQSFNNTKYPKELINIVIVDDGSNEENSLNGSYINSILDSDLYFNIRTTHREKDWCNPSIPYNIAFDEVNNWSLINTDIIILNSADCVHNGDIFMEASKLQENEYKVFGCYSLDKEQTNQVLSGSSEPIILNNRPAMFDGDSAWYHHSEFRPTYYHFCSAINFSDLKKLSGFDERYGYGNGYDDNDLLHRIRNLGLNVNSVDKPYVLHLNHYNNYSPSSNKPSNQLLFNETIKSKEYNVAKYNKYFVHEI